MNWQLVLSQRNALVGVSAGAGADNVSLPDSGAGGDYFGSLRDYEAHGSIVDLNGDGWNVVAESDGSVKVGDWLPGAQYERVGCRISDLGESISGEQTHGCHLEQWDGQVWKIVWRSEDLPAFVSSALENGRPVIGDIDNDGELEVAVVGWYYVHVLNLIDGTLEYSGEFTAPGGDMSGRAYGQVVMANIDGDPQLEVVLLADFLPHLHVLDLTANGQLEQSWERIFEPTILRNQKIHFPVWNAVSDVDGDGVNDIVTNVFNENGDGRWHTLVLGGSDGSVKADLTDLYLVSAADLNGDSVAELLLQETDGQKIRSSKSVVLGGIKSGEYEEYWRLAGSGYSMSLEPDFPDYINSDASGFKQQVAMYDGLLANGKAFLTRKSIGSDLVRMTFWEFDGSNVIERGSVSGPDLAVVGSDSINASGKALLRSRYLPGAGASVSATKAEIDLLAWRIGDRESSGNSWNSLLTGTIVAPQNGVNPLLVSEGDGQRILAYEIVNGQPTLKWSVPGRGMFSGAVGVAPNNSTASVASFEPFGDKNYHVLVARESDIGAGALAAIRPDGTTLWEVEFPVRGKAPTWNISGVTHWLGGNFRSADQQDVYAVVRRSNMHTEEGFLLDGKTGEVVWSNQDGAQYSECTEAGEKHRSGPNAFQVSLIDYDGDGLDDITDATNFTYAVYDGATGETRVNRYAAQWCGAASPLFDEDVFANGALLSSFSEKLGTASGVLFGQNDVTMAWLQPSGSVNWRTPTYQGMPSEVLQVPADLDGDGQLEVVVVGHCGTPGSEVRAFNLDTGKLRWSYEDSNLCNWPSAHHPSAADIDGDGRDEIVYTHQNTITSIGEEFGRPYMQWRVEVEEDSWNKDLGSPVIAQTQKGGALEIIVNAADGTLYSLGE
ncbi:MAG: FG-GAP-like repeat-containing protein [Halioglobus sp.]